MKVIVTIKSFDDNMEQYDFLIPTIVESMDKLIHDLISLEKPIINVDGLNAVHFTDNYREELFAFQETIGHPSFATRNKIADGYAQVVLVEEGKGMPEDVGYHIFISKFIPMSIVVCQWLEDHVNQFDIDEELLKKLGQEKNSYIRMIRHELCHVEDENNQKKWKWLEEAFSEHNLQTVLRYDAYRLWEEFYACRRSNFIYTPESAVQEMTSLLRNLENAEKEVCNLRWKYNNRIISLDEFVRLLHEYIRSAFIYGCYFMGHMDSLYEYIIDQLKPELYPSRFYPYLPEMWRTLRKMGDKYPIWNGPEIFDELVETVLKSINEFEVYPQDTARGLYYDIPVVYLHTRSEETKGNDE